VGESLFASSGAEAVDSAMKLSARAAIAEGRTHIRVSMTIMMTQCPMMCDSATFATASTWPLTRFDTVAAHRVFWKTFVSSNIPRHVPG
jgi:hypothetical protein